MVQNFHRQLGHKSCKNFLILTGPLEFAWELRYSPQPSIIFRKHFLLHLAMATPRALYLSLIFYMFEYILAHLSYNFFAKSCQHISVKLFQHSEVIQEATENYMLIVIFIEYALSQRSRRQQYSKQ